MQRPSTWRVALRAPLWLGRKIPQWIQLIRHGSQPNAVGQGVTYLGHSRSGKRAAVNRWGSKRTKRLQRVQRPSPWRVAFRAPLWPGEKVRQMIEDARRGPRTLFASSPSGRFREGTGGSRLRVPTTVLIGVALAIVAATLALVALRSEITRTRYDLSQATAKLLQLDEQSRELTLHLRQLRDPRRLGEIARARGFGPAEHIVELP